MNKTKVQWRKSPYTDDLDDRQKCKFYHYRHHAVRAIQKQNEIARTKNKELANAGFSNKKDLHNPMLELSDTEVDKLAREAYDSQMMPVLHDGKIVLTKAPMMGDMPC